MYRYITFLFFFVGLLFCSSNEVTAQSFPDTTYICSEYNNNVIRMGVLTIDKNSEGNYVCKFFVSLALNDNTYGLYSHSTWKKKVHRFTDLTHSELAQFEVKNAANNKVLAFTLDYISASGTFPSGYGCLGAFGGEGLVTTGNPAWILGYNSSLSRNLNEHGYLLTTNSANPGTTSDYQTDPAYPNWEWPLVYEVTIDKAVFGTGGYGKITVTGMHNSPPKIETAVSGFFECDPLPGSIGDKAWNDDNMNGIQDAGELGINNIAVNLYKCDSTLIRSTVTNSSGIYNFNDLTPGSYYVQFVLPYGYQFSPKDMGGNDVFDSDADPVTGKTICTNITEAENDMSWDAGISQLVLTCDVGDKVWKDLDHNGIQDTVEPGVQGVTLQLYNCDNVLIASAVTDAAGKYIFENVASGDYYIKLYAPDGYTITPKDAAGDDLLDSDFDPTTGKSTCFSVDGYNCGNNDIKWDAGVYPTPAPTGSIGDQLWKDINGNGIQGSGEPGYHNIWVGLFDCSDNLIRSTTTDINGKYLFDNLAAGNYLVQFNLPQGYVFSPQDQGIDDAVDSDVFNNGKTNCIALASGEHNLTIDAGVTITPHPLLYVEKDDYKLYMPAVGATNTYIITYGNTGNISLQHVKLTDTLPAGSDYLSCTGGTTCGETSYGVVEFNIGTLTPGQTGQVQVHVTVTTLLDEYLNKVTMVGQDPSNNYLYAHDEDLDIADTCSGGGGGGVESRGDMAELLLKRQLLIKYGMTTKLLSLNKGMGINALELSSLVPAAGPYYSSAVETTPFDILGISNAVSAYAVDYIGSFSGAQKRVAGIFATVTLPPYIYDHTKAVCDRLAGAEITQITRETIEGHQFYAAKFVRAKESTSDYAISFSAYETVSGFIIDNHWTYGEYVVPSNAQNVYNFQVWSGTLEDTKLLVKNILALFSTHGNLTYAINGQITPETFISKAEYTHDGRINLHFTNNGTAKQVSLIISFRYSQGETPYSTTKTYTVPVGSSLVSIPLGILADASISMMQPQGFRDEIYVSGGAYTFVNGPASIISSFNTTGYDVHEITEYPQGSAVLSGGASVSGTLNDWVSLVRALTTSLSAYDLSSTEAIRFDAKGTGAVDVILDQTNTMNYNYHAYPITLTSEYKEYVINFKDFHERWGTQTPVDPSLIRYLGLILDKSRNTNISACNMEIKNIAFVPNAETEIEEKEIVPTEFLLSQNYPNPFNPSTVVEFSIPYPEYITLKVYDILGREIKTLVNGTMNPGVHRVLFNASNLASGVYLYRLSGTSINITKKMLFTK